MIRMVSSVWLLKLSFRLGSRLLPDYKFYLHKTKCKGLIQSAKSSRKYREYLLARYPTKSLWSWIAAK